MDNTETATREISVARKVIRSADDIATVVTLVYAAAGLYHLTSIGVRKVRSRRAQKKETIIVEEA